MRIQPSFEDAHFAVRYLLDLPRPVIGLLQDSVYVYRKRAAGTSLMQGSMRHPGRYTDVLELGYLDIIERGRRPDGSVPAWIQQLLVYELSWYLSGDERISTTVRVPPELAPRFHELFDRILRELEPAVVARHRSRDLEPVWRDLLGARGTRRGLALAGRREHAGRSDDGPAPVQLPVRRTATGGDVPGGGRGDSARIPEDDGPPLFRARLPVGADPLAARRAPAWRSPSTASQWHRRGRGRAWRSQRRRDVGAALSERIRLLRDGGPGYLRAGIARRTGRVLRDAVALPQRFAARRRLFGARFRDAWVLMDRIHDADDNGERLFEHLRATRPDINAWFVLERGTPDWERLAARGESRLVAHGSWTWKMLMLNCAWLISSHIDQAIVRPPEILRILPKPAWRFGFLQHGVIKDDLSRWLNRVEADLVCVSTEAELASVVGDGTAYRWTAKEARITGLPRFDRLLAKGNAVPPEERDLVIVAPTWRQWLTLPLASGSQRRDLDSTFRDSDYMRSWTALLGSPKIADAVARRGWRLGFMPHPNLQSMLGQLDLPAHVEPLSFAGVDVQELYARCALLVTDYSSVAFNTAYLDRPVVYFQFDRDAMLGGQHVGRRGYFEYERDGFGPVAEDLRAAERAIVAAIERGPQPARKYRRRIAAAFPRRDGQASARVVAAVEEMSRPWAAGTQAAVSPRGHRSV